MKHVTTAFKTYKLTTYVTVCSALFSALVVGLGLDVFEKSHIVFHEIIMLLEVVEGDEFILVPIIIGMALIADLLALRRQARRSHELDEQRIQVMRSTMATVQDVVNNFLNNLQLFRFEAERSRALDKEYLKLFDDLIEETAQKIKDIEEMEIIAERQVCTDITALEVGKK